MQTTFLYNMKNKQKLYKKIKNKNQIQIILNGWV